MLANPPVTEASVPLKPSAGPVLDRRTWRGELWADQSTVSDPPPPSRRPARVAPLVKRKVSAPLPPVRPSNPANASATPPLVYVGLADTDHDASASRPVRVSDVAPPPTSVLRLVN